jgi:hypothetical protein
MTIEGDRSHLKVKIVKIAPLSTPDQYISFLDAKDQQIGLMKDLSGLDETSRKIVEEELSKRYLTFMVHKVRSIRSEFGVSYWEVDTDRGPRDFVARDVHENVLHPGPGRSIILDVEGNRFEIADVTRLDKKSTGFINTVL